MKVLFVGFSEAEGSSSASVGFGNASAGKVLARLPSLRHAQAQAKGP